MFCFLSIISFVLRKLTQSVLRYSQKEPNTACLEHIVSLSTKYGRLYNETRIKLLLNIDAIHPKLYFSLNFIPIFLLS